jgi:hypothetical protein
MVLSGRIPNRHSHQPPGTAPRSQARPQTVAELSPEEQEKLREAVAERERYRRERASGEDRR